MHYRMREGLSWCTSEGRPVFLDLASDRYFRLRPEDERAFQIWARSEATTGYEPAGLVRAGILVACRAPEPPRPRTEVTMPTVDLGEESGGRAHPVAMLRAAIAQRRAAKAVRAGKLGALIAEIAREPSRSTARDGEGTARRIAAAFASTPLSFRKAGQCVPRALAAHHLCRRHGVATRLIFGVRLEPFAAHCWLQFGQTVVVGDLEQARLFIPILAVP